MEHIKTQKAQKHTKHKNTKTRKHLARLSCSDLIRASRNKKQKENWILGSRRSSGSSEDDRKASPRPAGWQTEIIVREMGIGVRENIKTRRIC